MSDDGPSILITGGLGMIGRRLVKYILNNDLAYRVRVVDKALPEMSYLSDEYKAMFKDPRVEVVQGILPDHVDRAFEPSNICPNPFQLVVSLAAATDYGASESNLQRMITDNRIAVAKKAAQLGVEKLIEVSTGQVYSGSSHKGAKEDDAKSPWTNLAKYHLMAEEALKGIPGLNYSILRLPVVYGESDRTGLMPRVLCARVYEYTEETMQFLWGEDLRVHTVHVQDAAAAIWHLICAGAQGEAYNLTDQNDTSQGKLNSVLEKMFKVKTGFVNTLFSHAAKLKMDEIVNEANEGHMGPWLELCKSQKIYTSPLSPWLEKAVLLNNNLAMDSSKIAATGFQCSCPQLNPDLVMDSIRYWAALGLFPVRQP